MIGTLKATTVRVPSASIFDFQNGKISAQQDMFDMRQFLVQLGVVSPPSGPHSSPSVTPKNE